MKNRTLLFHAGAMTALFSIPISRAAETPDKKLQDTTVTAVGEAHGSVAQQADAGASPRAITRERIDATPKGSDASLTSILVRTPGVAPDGAAAGGMHVRGEHSNLQYRVNGILLPEGVTGFGGEFDPRFIGSVSLVTGALPAQYGFRTAGVVDIVTKSAADNPGGTLDVTGGSLGLIRLYGAYADANDSGFEGFVSGGVSQSMAGIENPTRSYSPIHDRVDRASSFLSLSQTVDDKNKVLFLGGYSNADFELPNTPDLAPGTAPGGAQWVPGSFDSAALDQRQSEKNLFGALAWKHAGEVTSAQVSLTGRHGNISFAPDRAGDLFFNGVAGSVDRTLDTGGLQADASTIIDSRHTLRYGAVATGSVAETKTRTTAFDLDSSENPVGAPRDIDGKTEIKGLFAGVYAQDTWKVTRSFTVDFGARIDVFAADFSEEWQLSPRLGLTWEADKNTVFHAGYARYFTPPPLENLGDGDVAKYDGTSNAAAQSINDHAKAERSHYIDAGVTRRLGSSWTIGLDAYMKWARNQLDDGLFGQSMIPATFNYEKGEIYGVELPITFEQDAFSAYSNIAYSVARGKNWVSSQYLFEPDDTAHVRDNWVFLDHDMRFTGSAGISYTFGLGTDATTRVFADILYGTGLRTDAPGVPNGASLSNFYTLNLGVLHTHKLTERSRLRARLDLTNITDNRHVIRDGEGIGVNAAQYAEPFGVYASLGISF